MRQVVEGVILQVHDDEKIVTRYGCTQKLKLSSISAKIVPTCLATV